MPVFRKRASGVGQVPLAALIVFIALFVITGALSYVFYQQMSKRRAELQSAEQARDTARAERDAMEKSYLEIQKLLGWEDPSVPGQLLKKVEDQRAELIAPLEQQMMEEMAKALSEMPEGLEGVPEEAQQMLQAMQQQIASGELRGPEGFNILRQLLGAEQPLTLSYVLPDRLTHATFRHLMDLTYFLIDLRDSYLKAWQATKEAFDKESVLRRQAEIARDFAIMEREAQLQEQRKVLEIQIEELRRNLSELKEIHDDLSGKYVDEIAEKDKLADLSASLQETVKAQEDTILALETKLAKRAIFAKAAELEPDGEILNLDQQLGFAYINLGRDENVQPGWRFKVVRKTPRGYDAIGEAEVRRVEEKVSRIAVRADSLRVPVVKGDFIANPAYDPKKTIMFAFAGKLDAFTIKQAQELAEIYGAKVADTLSAYVDYLVIGKDPGEAMEQARRYGVAIMTQEQFLDYVGSKF
jgi:hypothetical protein